MEKKTTTIAAGIVLGVSLLAGAGYGIYKYFSRKLANKKGGLASVGGGGLIGNGSSFIGNSLVKSNSLYEGANSGDGLVGGGLVNIKGHLIGNG
ncbi:hypothetical protein GCM10027592_00440 [Spirosoma flavus]